MRYVALTNLILAGVYLAAGEEFEPAQLSGPVNVADLLERGIIGDAGTAVPVSAEIGHAGLPPEVFGSEGEPSETSAKEQELRDRLNSLQEQLDSYAAAYDHVVSALGPHRQGDEAPDVSVARLIEALDAEPDVKLLADQTALIGVLAPFEERALERLSADQVAAVAKFRGVELGGDPSKAELVAAILAAKPGSGS